MILLPKTLQGTDGIRGRVDEMASFSETGALGYYLDSGFLTPAFFEKYTYAFGTLLIQSGVAAEGDCVVVGWDPRDEKGLFNRSAMTGVLKTGLNVIKIGVLPTPAIPIYMLSCKAAGGIALTASHNPSDQNGIKLFAGFTALKFLPRDDEQLTSIISDQQALNLETVPTTGNLVDHSTEAKQLFVDYHHDPANSWINQKAFEDTILIIDASKGAVSTVVEDIFSNFRFKELITTNQKGAINERCGVADIEGIQRITTADVQPNGARFFGYETLERIFAKSQELPEIKDGTTKLIALVFDGDGDRCFRLDYNPKDDDLIVSSGDLLGIHQAKYLMSKGINKKHTSLFVNTVESDLKTGIFAGSLGYQPQITGVGDKWILQNAILDMIQAEARTDTYSGQSVLNAVNATGKRSDFSALTLSKLWKNYQLSNQDPLNNPDYRFSLGIEESGHSISPGFQLIDSKLVRTFAGNGIKSGLNSLIAISKNYENQSSEGWFDILAHPFSPGVKETYYTYYVVKSRLFPGSEFRTSLQSFIQNAVLDIFPSAFSTALVLFPEESSMLYCRISEGNIMKGAVFVRNSGTENKSALYLRGEQTISRYLKKLAEKLHVYILKGMKDAESDFVRFEMELLASCADGSFNTELIQNYKGLPVERILREIELKEGLISREKGNVQLTEKGKLFNEQW